MNLLAIDTSCSILSAAVCHGEEVHYTETDAGIRHSELVMGCIDSLMKKACLNVKNLEGVLCMRGPGSFTGLRIGYSIAKGLALSHSIPFIAIPTLDCIAFSHQESCLLPSTIVHRVLPVIQARKSSWFFSIYQGEKCLFPPVDAVESQIAAEIMKNNEIYKNDIILSGPGAVSLYASLPQKLKESLIPVFETRGYAKELISIAKKNNLLDNNIGYLYSGPEYFKMG
jgi:tRNA threonylcarbamoyladenosine biosynthesis protein TsaB